MLSDYGTVGGYPKIAVVISADHDRLTQLTPGSKIKFKLVELNEEINSTSFNEVARKYNKSKNVKKLILLRPTGEFPKALVDKLRKDSTKIGMSEVYFFEDKIWVI